MESQYLSGIIEGFYGKPWTHNQRLAMIDDLATEQLNTYMYAPKFDPNHRIKWQEPYSDDMLKKFGELCCKGKDKNIQIILALSPGLSINQNNYSDLIRRFRELFSTGPSGLALLLDDIPCQKADANEHVDIMNLLIKAVPENVRWYFCPTAYSGYHLKTWDQANLYLETIGNKLPENIHVFWTGNTIISKTITNRDLEWFQHTVKRKPLLWDNFAADDYVPANSFFPGPLTGRSNTILNSSEGLLLNPSQIYHASRMALFQLAQWLSTNEEYSPPKAFEYAISRITQNNEAQSVLTDVFGYFYTPFDLSEKWIRILQQFEFYYLNPSSESSPAKLLKIIRDRLRNDRNLVLLDDIWIEIFPFVRTLLGDLDYLISVCDKIENNPQNRELLVPRDARWITPVNTLVSKLRNKV